MVTHKGKAFTKLLSASKIFVRVNELAAEIEKHYIGEALCVLSVLDGSFVFTSDLVRAFGRDVEVAFCKYSSYHGQKSSGKITEILPVPDSIAGKHVLIAEDIVDTGLTIKHIESIVRTKNAKSVRIASFLFKPTKLQTGTPPDFVGFEISDKFVIGYGMDYDGFGRNLAAIYQLRF